MVHTDNMFIQKLEPLSKEITDDMVDILDRIESGEYNHDQSNWHCGSAHCFFGWKHIRDIKKTLEKDHSDLLTALKVIETSSVLCLKNSDKSEARKAWRKGLDDLIEFTNIENKPDMYAQDSWGLTDAETEYLSASARSFKELKLAVGLLQEGKRYFLETLLSDEVKNIIRSGKNNAKT